MRTDHEGPDETRTYHNTPEGALDLDVFLPAATPAAGPRPAIVFFFGGGWVKGHHWSDRRAFAVVLNRHGPETRSPR